VLADRNRPHHGHQEFLRFLNRLERDIPADKLAHVVLDNDGSHTHPKLRVWPARHRRWTFHFTPTSASWLNAVEGFFAELTRRRLQRGVFRSLVDSQAAINRHLADHNASPKPFIWTADPDTIIAALRQTEGTKR
jgi:transposase